MDVLQDFVCYDAYATIRVADSCYCWLDGWLEARKMTIGSNIGAGTAAEEISTYIKQLLEEPGVAEETRDALTKVLKKCEEIIRVADLGMY